MQLSVSWQICCFSLPGGVSRETWEGAEAKGAQGEVQSEEVRAGRMCILMSSVRTGHAQCPRDPVDTSKAPHAHFHAHSNLARECAKARQGERQEKGRRKSAAAFSVKDIGTQVYPCLDGCGTLCNSDIIAFFLYFTCTASPPASTSVQHNLHGPSIVPTCT